jgi:hypothetical protein
MNELNSYDCFIASLLKIKAHFFNIFSLRYHFTLPAINHRKRMPIFDQIRRCAAFFGISS